MLFSFRPKKCNKTCTHLNDMTGPTWLKISRNLSSVASYGMFPTAKVNKCFQLQKSKISYNLLVKKKNVSINNRNILYYKNIYKKQIHNIAANSTKPIKKWKFSFFQRTYKIPRDFQVLQVGRHHIMNFGMTHRIKLMVFSSL